MTLRGGCAAFWPGLVLLALQACGTEDVGHQGDAAALPCEPIELPCCNGANRCSQCNQVYDIATGEWHVDTHAGICIGNRPTVVPLLDGRFLVVATDGCVTDAPKSLDPPPRAWDRAVVYDPATRRWCSSGPSPRDQEWDRVPATRLVDGRVLILPATPYGALATRSTRIFDPRTHRLAPGPLLARERVCHGGVVTLRDGRVVLFGGLGSLENFGEPPDGTTESELIDVARGRSGTLPDLPVPLFNPFAFLLPDGQVLGGADLAGLAERGEVVRFDPASESWSIAAALPVPLLHVTAVQTEDGRVAVGGATWARPDGGGVAAVYVTHDGSHWDEIPMLRHRHGLTGVAISPDEVLLMGGFVRGRDGFEAILVPDVEVVNLTTRQSALRAPLPYPKYDSAAIFAGDHVVLLGGSVAPH